MKSKVARTKSEPVSKKPTVEEKMVSQPEVHTVWKEKKHHGGDGYVGAIVLITVGILFLLNNFGFIPWEIWGTLWRFWPVFFVFWGIELIFGKSWLGKFISAILVILILCGIAGFAVLLTDQAVRNAVDMRFPGLKINSIQDLGGKLEEKTLTLKRDEFTGIEKMETQIDISSGVYTVSDSADNELITVKSKFDSKRFTPVLESSMASGILKANFKVDSVKVLDFSALPLHNDVILGTNVRNDLKVTQSSGTGKITLDESNLGLFQVHMSSGNLDVNLSKNAIPVRDSSIDVSSGSFSMYVPANVAVKVTYSVSSGSFRVNGTSLRGNGTYYTEDYDNSDSRMTLDVHISSGSVSIANR